MRTGNNERFLRFWFEISNENLGLGYKHADEAKLSGKRWFPYNKGGNFRKWYGNNEYVVLWENNGYAIKQNTLDNYPQLSWDNLGWKISNESYYFLPALTWSATSSSNFGIRHSDKGFLFDVKGSSCFCPTQLHYPILGLLASSLISKLLAILNPTIEFQSGDIKQIPICKEFLQERSLQEVEEIVTDCVSITRTDWDAYETSWSFTSPPLLALNIRQATLQATYIRLRAQWQEMTLEMQRLEEQNNRIIIDAYGLQEELPDNVLLKEITLTCNPHYRYGGDKNEEELEALLLADSMKEFISYAVGCMFGRYALDKPGLILANQGETIDDYLQQIPDPTFPADVDNAIPMLDGDWFPDDVAERFRSFLRVTFGAEHYEENLVFIERAIGKEIRKYFLRDFYNDHVKRYKKRPIYWLFSSPKGSFNVLIYMHRYRPDTVSVVLNDYLREFRTKLTARKSHLEGVSISTSETQSARTKALKEIEKLNKVIDELETYERDVLYPLATEQVSIDLDDGVKVNYNKFGTALKKVAGLTAK